MAKGSPTIIEAAPHFSFKFNANKLLQASFGMLSVRLDAHHWSSARQTLVVKTPRAAACLTLEARHRMNLGKLDGSCSES